MAPIVHTYRSDDTGLFVNSYLIEGTEGVVAIDAPLLLPDGRAFRARLEALRRPLLGVLVTHPHPDQIPEARPFEDAYRSAGASLEASPHCERYEVARCTEDPAAHRVDSSDGHLRGFRGSPEFRSFVAAVRPYVERIEEMRHYEFKTAGSR